MDRFPICLPFVLSMECPHPNDWSNPANFSNDPHDPGGATMCGITTGEYAIYREQHGLPMQSVVLITEAEGDEIYEDGYWQPKSPTLPPGLDLSWFDTDVNCGAWGATIILQRALGVAADGVWGPITQAAVTAIADVPAAIRAFTAAREAYYRALAGFPYFGHGWMHRALAIGSDSLSMANTVGNRGIKLARPFVKTVKAYKMATPAEISAGTNAALPAAQSFIDSFVPEAFQSEVNAKIPQLVAICVENAIPAVDAYRLAHPPTQGV